MVHLSNRLAEDFEKNKEWYEFMEELKQIHSRKGTYLKMEPVLGGKKIDMLKLYRLVIAAGGSDKVSLERKWKRIGEEFDLPDTCTNSAFILKEVFYKFMKDYEDIHVHGMDVNELKREINIDFDKPKERQSMSGQQAVRPDYSIRMNHLPSAMVNIALAQQQQLQPIHLQDDNEADKHRSLLPNEDYIPTILPVIARKIPKIDKKPKEGDKQSKDNILIETDKVSDKSETDSDVQPSRQEIQKQQINKKKKLSNIHYDEHIEKRLQELTFKKARMELSRQPRVLNKDGRNKIRLALESGLQNEASWALHHIRALSMVCEDNFNLEDIPNLLDAFIAYADNFSHPIKVDDEETSNIIPNGSFSLNTRKLNSILDMAVLMDYDGEIEGEEEQRTHSAAAIRLMNNELLLSHVQTMALTLRNFALMECNKKCLAKHTKVCDYVIECLHLPNRYPFVDVRQYAREIFESFASEYVIKWQKNQSIYQDHFMRYLRQCMYSEDRTDHLFALKCLLEMSSNRANHDALLRIDGAMLSQTYELLCVSDNELREEALEWVYRYTRFSPEAEERVMKSNLPFLVDYIRARESGLNLQQVLMDTNPIKSNLQNIHHSASMMGGSTIINKPINVHSGNGAATANLTTHQQSQLPQQQQKEEAMHTMRILEAAQWMHSQFEECESFMVIYHRMYHHYCETMKSRHLTLLDMVEFSRILTTVYTNCALQEVIKDGRRDFYVSGLSLRNKNHNASVSVQNSRLSSVSSLT